MKTTFQQLGLGPEILKALEEIGFDDPFPIQEAAIPFILKGIDVIGQAHTGTGKTAAFSLPILTRIEHKGPVQALILVPTRELAVQVTSEINRLAKYTGIRTVSVYGGQNINIQHDLLKRGAQIIVATPGRLIDHIKHGSIQLENVKHVVLDEADRMLDMGFIDDIKFILFYVNEDRQTCLFSATMPPEIMRLAQEYMKDPEDIRLNKEELGLDTIDQCYLIVHEREKFKHLCYFINSREKKQTIIFSATKQRTQRLAGELRQEGFKAITIHGDLSQKQRDNAMYRFKRGSEDILVATDIAARGIDVPAVGHVINYDIPEDPLIYFHRIGRTARAGGSGKAVSLVSHDRIEDFDRILRQTEQPIRKLNEEMGVVEVHTNRHHFTTGHQRRRSFSHNYNAYRQGYRGTTYYDTWRRRRYNYGQNQNQDNSNSNWGNQYHR